MSSNDLFNLGGQLEAQGRYDEAFAAFAEANRAQRDAREAAKAEAAEIGGLGDVLRTFSPQFFARNAGGGDKSKAPILIVGMPRSGTTLLEHVLASHPQVTNLGEIDALRSVVANDFPMKPRAEMKPNHFKRLATGYLRGAQAAGWKSTGRFVDRQLSNRWLLGVARMMLPNATIIHAVRDPIDTCLSAYLVQFQAGLPLANDLGDIGRQYVRYRSLMDYWARNLPGDMIHVYHDGLVGDPEDAVRRLIDAVGLPWDDRCLRLWEQPTGVSAAPATLFGETVGRWRRYEKHLKPLIDALGPYVSEVKVA